MKVHESKSDLAIKLAVCFAMIASLFGCGHVPSLSQRGPMRPAAKARMIAGHSEAMSLGAAPRFRLEVHAGTSEKVKPAAAKNGAKQCEF
ncbi:MAG TPA: hypothetical protein VGG62_15590 [Terracidiphilus sp.]|jgi:hypothetical protein